MQARSWTRAAAVVMRAAACSMGTAAALVGTAGAVTPVRTGAAGGYSWAVPGGWTDGAPRAMRVATYTVPPAGRAEPGECAVFFFGSGEGGSIEANVERWSKQFEGAPRAERSERVVRGVRITEVRIAGTYLAPGGPNMQSQGKKADHLLRGAIAQTPQGSLFFKLTGPAATVIAANPSWDALLQSLGPASGPADKARTPIR